MSGQHRPGYMPEYRAKAAALAADGGLLPFQASFVRAVCREHRPPRDCRRQLAARER